MTPSPVSPMTHRNTEAGRELDALIAEKVMGWTWRRVRRRERALKYLAPPQVNDERHFWDDGPVQGGEDLASDGLRLVAQYSTDIAAAWLVVRKLRALGYHLDLMQNHEDASICAVTGLTHWYAASGWAKCGGEEMPLAICLAAHEALTNPRTERRAALSSPLDDNGVSAT